MDNQDKYKCDICNKSYSNYESLWKHKKMINNTDDKTEKKDKCIYCDKIYNPKHVRFNLENVIDHNKIISEHEQECKNIFEDAQECKNKIIELDEDIELLENELAKKCSVNNKKSRRY